MELKKKIGDGVLIKNCWTLLLGANNSFNLWKCFWLL